MQTDAEKIAELFGFSDEEIAVLKKSETRFGFPLFQSEFQRKLSDNFINGQVLEDTEVTYWTNSDQQVLIDPERQKPEYHIEVDKAGDVSVIVDNLQDGLIPYFEFDCDPGFNSNRVLRNPPLATFSSGFNLKASAGVRLQMYNTISRKYAVSNVIRMPIRPHAFFLIINRDQLAFSDYAKMSHMLTYGIHDDRRRMIEEVYNFALHHFLWGDDRYMKYGFEMFVAGVGGCGNVNNFVGEILEMQGIRYRLASGFNPLIRQYYPGGGHSAIELLIDGKWSFIDAYLDIQAIGVAASQLASSEYADYHVFAIDNSRCPEEICGKSMTLGKLFRYRSYSDLGRRNITHSMVNLNGDEGSYGRDWDLRTLGDDERLDLKKDVITKQKLHVRGRYMASSTPLTYGGKGMLDPAAVAGDWVEKEIVLNSGDYF